MRIATGADARARRAGHGPATVAGGCRAHHLPQMTELRLKRLAIHTQPGYVVPAGDPVGIDDRVSDVRERVDVVIRTVLRDRTGWFVAFHTL